MAQTIVLVLFDIAMCAGLIWLALSVLVSTDLFKAVVLFISFGLMMALIWVRLKAPDVALAEAAIGAGVTGVLLLATLARLPDEEVGADPLKRKCARRGLSGATTLLVATISLSLVNGPLAPDSARQQVAEKLTQSGVENPVTAVLLNFRGYDTMLEVVVLLVAVMVVWSLGAMFPRRSLPVEGMLGSAIAVLVPVMIVIATYLLWIGAFAPGGAFQAGAVLAAAGLLLLMIYNLSSMPINGKVVRLVLVAGPLVYTLSALAMRLLEGHLLQYPPAVAGAWMLLIEFAAMLSIAATLITLILGGRVEHSSNAGDAP